MEDHELQGSQIYILRLGHKDKVHVEQRTQTQLKSLSSYLRNGQLLLTVPHSYIHTSHIKLEETAPNHIFKA